MNECECGCGNYSNSRFLSGHNRNKVTKESAQRNALIVRDKVETEPCDKNDLNSIIMWMKENINCCPICSIKFQGSKSFYRHIDSRCYYKEELEKFKQLWSNYLCHCGCGSKTLPGRRGLPGHGETPPWNKGLTKETDLSGKLQQTSERRIDEMQQYPGKSGKWMSHTSIEMKVKEFLETLGIKFYHQFSLDYKYVVDFCILEQKLIIECDGNFWHNYPNGTEKDKEENKYIINKGWDILRFWESEINNDFEQVCNRISETVVKLKGVNL